MDAVQSADRSKACSAAMEAYRAAFADHGDHGRAYDLALDMYCRGTGRAPDVRAQVYVGVMIAETADRMGAAFATLPDAA